MVNNNMSNEGVAFAKKLDWNISHLRKLLTKLVYVEKKNSLSKVGRFFLTKVFNSILNPALWVLFLILTWTVVDADTSKFKIEDSDVSSHWSEANHSGDCEDLFGKWWQQVQRYVIFEENEKLFNSCRRIRS